MDALAATKPGVFVIDIKTIPAIFHITYQPRQKSKLAPKASAGDKTGLTDFVISRRATGRATDEQTDWRQELQTGDRQHAQEQIQQKQNINLSRP